MALETDRRAARDGDSSLLLWRDRAYAVAQMLRARLPGWLFKTPLLDWYVQTRFHKAVLQFFNRSIRRRIFVSNIAGLLVLMAGLFYQSHNHAWLVESRIESLELQAKMMAQALAGAASVDGETISVNPDRLFEPNDQRRPPWRDDGFTALQLPLPPERIVPLVGRMTQEVSTRARVYDVDGELIVDSNALRSRSPNRADAAAHDDKTDTPVSARTTWTRFLSWLKEGNLPVYRDIGRGNGKQYKQVVIALAGVAAPMLLITDDGQELASIAVPIQRQRTVQGALLLSTQPGEFERYVAQERNRLLGFMALAILTTLLASSILARSIAGPMRRLSDSAERISHNINARHQLPDLSYRKDEIGAMHESFETMTSALYRRIEASDRFAQDVAHELKNPLTAARATAETMVLYARTDEQRKQLAGQILDELQRLNRLITDISNASRLDAELARQETKPVDLLETSAGVVSIFKEIVASRDGEQIVELDKPALGAAPNAFVVQGHEGRLSQVITNLVDNALSFSPRKGRVTIRLARMGQEIELSVEDEGPGIPENKLDGIFARFYSDRPQSDATTGKNSGLGLSISREIVIAHGGRVWAENRAATGGQRAEAHDVPELGARQIDGVAGARFVVRLPAATLRR
jgi:two-component system sensor histidine kinase ChvG